ncbi:MAG: hypothetical protein EOM37_05675 [Proteobacteria bacterium]|nr:hypothetical protein [Pseudomonadota bacterium]
MQDKDIHIFFSSSVKTFKLPGLLLCLFLTVLVVSGCGKRPSQVDTPAHNGQITYPRIYPDPATDPKP